MRVISPFLIMSTQCGRPSVTLLTVVTDSPASERADAVPRVAQSENPSLAKVLAISRVYFLSESRTLMNARPDLGSFTPAANCDLTNASAKLGPTPITSPVDFISGPRIVSTPGNLMNGNTASLTEK